MSRSQDTVQIALYNLFQCSTLRCAIHKKQWLINYILLQRSCTLSNWVPILCTSSLYRSVALHWLMKQWALSLRCLTQFLFEALVVAMVVWSTICSTGCSTAALVDETMSAEFEMFEAINESVDYHSKAHVGRSIWDDKEIQWQNVATIIHFRFGERFLLSKWEYDFC